MPISSSAVPGDKRRAFRLQTKGEATAETHENKSKGKNFLTIGPALPPQDKKLYKRSHSTLSTACVKRDDTLSTSEALTLHSYQNGILISRTQKEKEKNPDRINLDRRGLSALPLIAGEPKLRLLSLQHNLINNLDRLKEQRFPFLVFLDIYNNQLEKINCLDKLENLRVLLIGKNRIRKIEGLQNVLRIEVLDLHGNQIQTVSGLSALTDLKVLNLAGNQIRAIGPQDLHGLNSLQELNLRRNRIKKLLGFGDTPNLQKLFLSNNEVQIIEDMRSLAKSSNIKEISIDNNPVFLGGDCVSFLVSYLPLLHSLNSMQVTEQVRKAAMTWRRNKESTNSTFMDLASDVTLNGRREDVISNARTNWELIRSQTKCLTTVPSNYTVPKLMKLQPDSDFILTSLSKLECKNGVRSKPKIRVPALPDKKVSAHTPSQDTDVSQNTSSSNSGSDYFRLPPILVPIINKMEQKSESLVEKDGVKPSGSLSSIGPNIDSSVSSLNSTHSSSSEGSSSGDESEEEEEEEVAVMEKVEEPEVVDEKKAEEVSIGKGDGVKLLVETSSSNGTANVNSSDTSSNLSTNTTTSSVTIPSVSSDSGIKDSGKSLRSVRSAVNLRSVQARVNSRASTAKPKKVVSPTASTGSRDREQGGDYLIEICGRYLNIYGHGALRFVDKPWSHSKANDVYTINFNYANFNGITGILSKVKQRFPHAENFIFKETNISCLGQLNALAEIQGLSSLCIGDEGNPIAAKNWKSYAIFRLAHWGLKAINGAEVTEDEIKAANAEYQSLGDLVLWSLPDDLLQPLLVRLHIDVSQSENEQGAKKWLLAADPALKSVVTKEALQWKKGVIPQEDLASRQKAKNHISSMIDHMCNAVNKLRLLDKKWPTILQEIVQNTLLDYSQLDMHMKEKIQELK